jgi:hypothetical protein
MLTVLIPAVVIFLFLATIGISRPRKMKLTTWCWTYVIIAVAFDILTATAIILDNNLLIEGLLGVAAGSATSLAYHVWKEIKEFKNEDKNQLK